jgi:hypothetical protein
VREDAHLHRANHSMRGAFGRIEKHSAPCVYVAFEDGRPRFPFGEDDIELVDVAGHPTERTVRARDLIPGMIAHTRPRIGLPADGRCQYIG